MYKNILIPIGTDKLRVQGFFDHSVNEIRALFFELLNRTNSYSNTKKILREQYRAYIFIEKDM